MKAVVTPVSRFLKLALLAAVCASLAPVAAGAAQSSPAESISARSEVSAS